ncbi:hypothetical protein BvCmsSINP055_00065 [Escherichia coli]|nr:hypothetical protein BvCmsSINP055_00065 [Escherichia coli]
MFHEYYFYQHVPIAFQSMSYQTLVRAILSTWYVENRGL